MLNELWNRLRHVIGRGRVTLVNDSGPTQVIQAQIGVNWTQDKLPRVGEYGFQSNPPPGSDAVLVFLGGNPTDGVAIATGNQTYRIKSLATGEVAISDDKGQKIYLSAAGIRIDGGGLPIQITNTPSILADTPSLHCTGSITADGDVFDQGGAKSMAGMRDTFNTHKNSGNPLSTPTM